LGTRGIQAVEAAEALAPGQSAFCAKICSKIIVSQFCVVLVNNDIVNGAEIPNANVNMEYGLMLGFNKYVIPFQRESQTLPFNVAGLDTVKYSNQSFELKASRAIDTAIAATSQDAPSQFSPDQIISAFVLSKRLLFVPLTNEGDKNLFQFGQPLGFNLLMTFDGMRYVFFGNFTALRPEIALWRLRTLADIIRERVASLPQRLSMGMIADPKALTNVERFLNDLQIWLLLTSDDDREIAKQAIQTSPVGVPVQVLSLSEIRSTLQNIG
jgi:hypothetical protein